MAPELARLERVDLRDAWADEAGDFTPWLAETLEEFYSELRPRILTLNASDWIPGEEDDDA